MTKYVLAMTTGLNSVCKRIDIEVCGHEHVTLVNPSATYFYRYLKNSGTHTPL